MPSLATYCLPLALLAIAQAVAPAEDSNSLAGPSPRHTPLGLLLRKRSLVGPFRVPANPSIFSDNVMEAPRKREDDIWIWMPAHGYMAIPRDEIADQQEGQRGLGNLMRYG